MSNDDQVVLKFPIDPPEPRFLEIDTDKLELLSSNSIDNDDTTEIDTTLRIAGAKRAYWQKIFG